MMRSRRNDHPTEQMVNTLRTWLNARASNASAREERDVTSETNSLPLEERSSNFIQNYRELLLRSPAYGNPNWPHSRRLGAAEIQRTAQELVRGWEECMEDLRELEDLMRVLLRVAAIPQVPMGISLQIESGSSSDSDVSELDVSRPDGLNTREFTPLPSTISLGTSLASTPSLPSSTPTESTPAIPTIALHPNFSSPFFAIQIRPPFMPAFSSVGTGAPAILPPRRGPVSNSPNGPAPADLSPPPQRARTRSPAPRH